MPARSILIKWAASKDIVSAAEYYEEKNAGLGESFFETVDNVCESLLHSPHIGVPFETKFRKLIMNRFPYIIYYSVETEYIVILGVLHGKSRHEEAMKGRI